MHESLSRPLSPLTLHILTAVAREDMHGYALIKAVREDSRGAVSPGTGSLYAAVQRLIDEGLLAARAPESPGRRGSVYSITPAGRGAVLREKNRLDDLLQLIDDSAVLAAETGD